MSPEQTAATEAIRHGDLIPRSLDDKSDIYSLGVLLYESLAGRSPPADLAVSRRELRKAKPRLVVTCGRGSSACASESISFGKSAPPSTTRTKT